MGRRDILNGVLLAVIALGGASAVSALTTSSPYSVLLFWGGVVAMVGGGFGLYRLFTTAPASVGVPVEARQYLPPEITPNVLVEKTRDRTNVQIDALTRTYAGKWIRFEGQVRNVSAVSEKAWMLHLVIPNTTDSVSACFDEAFEDRLVTLSRNDWVTVEGKIEGLYWGPRLESADILHVGKTPAAKPRPRERVQKTTPSQ